MNPCLGTTDEGNGELGADGADKHANRHKVNATGEGEGADGDREPNVCATKRRMMLTMRSMATTMPSMIRVIRMTMLARNIMALMNFLWVAFLLS